MRTLPTVPAHSKGHNGRAWAVASVGQERGEGLLQKGGERCR